MNAPHAVTANERRATLISVLIVFMLSGMSQTVVATAMPRIIADLQGLELYAWVTTGYLLTSTVMVPIWGKLGDLYGRKLILLCGIAIFVTGSCLAGLSGEFGDLPILGGGMTQLVVFRALQGIGGGALFTVAFAIVADLYSPRERAQFSGIFGAMFGVASVIGPVVGGFLTDHGATDLFGHHIAGWRWVFYVNLPLSLLSVILILTKMPGLKGKRGTGGKVDLLGSALIITTFVPLLLALTWGGHLYAWTSPVEIALFATSIAGLVLFIVVERAVRDPIVPLGLFRNRVFATGNAATLVMGAAFMSVSSFLPLFMQVGQGVPATQSGLIMLSLMVGSTLSATINGRLVTRTGVYKPFMYIGGLILLGSVFAMTFIGPDTSKLTLIGLLFMVGIGLGPTQSLFSIAVQNAVEPHQMGVATSSGQFFRQVGSTIGVAVFGAVLTTNLAHELASRTPPQPAAASASAEPMDLADLQRMALERDNRRRTHAPPPTPEQQASERMVAESFSGAIVSGIWLSLLAVAAGLAVIVFIPARRLQDHPSPIAATAKAAE